MAIRTRADWQRLFVCHALIISIISASIWVLISNVAWAQEYSSANRTDACDTLTPLTENHFQSATGASDSIDNCPTPSPQADASSAVDDVQRIPPVTNREDAGEGHGAEPAFGGRFGMGPPGMGPGMGNQGPISFQSIWFPSVPVKGQAADWGLVGENFSLMHPLWVDLPNALMITGGVNNRLINTGAVLPDSHQPYPDNLWDVRLGLMYMRLLDAGRMLSFAVNVGSASDRPFASIEEMNASVMAMYRLPSGERNAWMFGLMYSPTSEIQFPIPSVSYSWNPSDQFHANLGLPFMFNYRPDDRWTFEASYMLIHTINAKCSYRLTDSLKIVGGYSWSNEIYMLYDRPEENDRFFLYDQRVSLGLESALYKHLTGELTGGYAFNRFSYTGAQWDSVQYDRVDIANGPFIILRGCLRY
jgi:hypothetical protein